jgi:DNA-binding MarR family transcriptional regulator
MRLMSSFDSLFSHAVAERAGMHSTDIETMDLLNVLGPMTAGQLSQMTGLSSGATTRLTDRLVRAGFVRRVPDEIDRRRVHIEPIGENLQAIGEMYGPLAEGLGRVWAAFSDEDLAVILRFVRESNAVVAAENARLRGQERPAGYAMQPPNPGHEMPHPSTWSQ